MDADIQTTTGRHFQWYIFLFLKQLQKPMIYRGIATHQPHLRHKVGTFIINVGGDLSAMISSKHVAATQNTTCSPTS